MIFTIRSRKFISTTIACGNGGFKGKANASKNTEALDVTNVMELSPY
jgi:hypothetical protein